MASVFIVSLWIVSVRHPDAGNDGSLKAGAASIGL